MKTFLLILACSAPALFGQQINPNTQINLKNVQGQLSALSYQTTPTSNNGIAMSLAECQTYSYACQVLVPALYAQTETQPWGGSFDWNYIVGEPSQGAPYSAPVGCYEDDRWGPPQMVCNSGLQPNNARGIGPVWVTNSSYKFSPLYSASAPSGVFQKNQWYGTHSFNDDQTANEGLLSEVFQYSPASTNANDLRLYDQSTGDAINPYIWDQTNGGLSTMDNEGVEGRYFYGEGFFVWQGTITSLSTAPATPQVCDATPCWIFNTALVPGTGNNQLGDDLQIIDITDGDSTGYITAVGTANAIASAGADWDSKYGDSNAHGTISARIDQNGGGTNIFPRQNVTVAISTASGTWNTTLPVCIFDISATHWECEPVTAASSSSITFAVVRRIYESGSVIAQGGMTGMGFSMQADQVGPGAPYGGGGAGLAGMGSQSGVPQQIIRSVWPIAYNSSGNQLAFMSGYRGVFQTRGYNIMGTGGSVTAALSGGAVTSCSASGGSGYFYLTDVNGFMLDPPQLSYAVNSGATAPVLALGYSPGALGTCIVIRGGSGITAITVAVTPTNPYTVYPMAHNFNVWNPVTGAVDGYSIATDAPVPNTTSYFQVGDTLEEPHYYLPNYTASNTQVNQYQASPSGVNGAVTYFGGVFGNNNYGQWLNNSNSTTLYQGNPAGTTPWVIGQSQMGTPYGYTLSGAWHNDLWAKEPPWSSGNALTGVVVVGCFDYVSQQNVCSKWATPYNMLLAENANNGGNGEDALQYSIPEQSWTLTAGATGSGGLGAPCQWSLTSIGFSYCNQFIVSGLFQNYMEYSNPWYNGALAPGWAVFGPTLVGNQPDPFGGTTGVTISGGSGLCTTGCFLRDTFSTTMSAGTAYRVCIVGVNSAAPDNSLGVFIVNSVGGGGLAGAAFTLSATTPSNSNCKTITSIATGQVGISIYSTAAFNITLYGINISAVSTPSAGYYPTLATALTTPTYTTSPSPAFQNQPATFPNLTVTGTCTGCGSVYTTTGTAITAPHQVFYSGTMTGGALAVVLSGSAIYTSGTSYSCTAVDTTTPGTAVAAGTYTDGSHFTVTGTGTDAVRGICTGN